MADDDAAGTPARGAAGFAQAPVIPQRSDDPTVMYGRLVVAVVVAIVLTVAAFAFGVGRYFAGAEEATAPQYVQVGPFTLLVSQDLPPTELVILSVLGIIVVAVFAVAFEAIAALMTVSPRRQRLSAYRPATRPPGDSGGQVRVTCLVPAHNEEFSLPTTLSALLEQTRKPDRVLVVADNCTDRTVEIAREMGFDAFETVDNVHKKGGALNQALADLLPGTDASDVILVMDADTSLAPRFIEVAAARLADDPELTAVGGVFYGEPGHGLIGQFQRNEYTRYSLQIRARHGRVFVLTGTATMFRADALLDVAAARGVFIPGETGKVYDTAALTEDNELTLALKSLGATMTSPRECMVTTEIMPAWKNLWIQRQRWQRGALENLSAYGITRATVRYWGQQVGIGYGTVALNLALLLMLITVLAIDEWIWFPFWIAVGAVFLVERVATAWRGGWKARGLAALLFPELAYDVYLQVVFLKCLLDITLNRRATWGHVQHPTAPLDA
ncbi:MAG: glycosyltransferase family 2 protein [Actinomycetota bacterium]|nr:glycosyltransferase family 2 protein [Actinomycetota bacterium]